MKRYFLLLAFLCLFVVSCQSNENERPISQNDKEPPVTSRTPDEKEPSASDTAQLENLLLVDGAGEDTLFLADNGLGNPGAVYTADVDKEVTVTIDNQSASIGDLKDGMILTVHHHGPIAESFPMQIMNVTKIHATTVPKEEYPDLCGFYLKVMDDIWQEDTALNGKIVGFDFSNLPAPLPPAVQFAVTVRFGMLHNVETIAGANRESLKQDGYITEEGWKDGCLITISPADSGKNENGILNFKAEKWHSPIGAVFWTDCYAEWKEDGAFPEYQVDRKAVSLK